MTEEHSNGDPICVSVAWLHDILEDTDMTALVLADKFGATIADAVVGVTDSKGNNRLEKQLNTYHRTRKNAVSTLVKLCDRLANMKNSIGEPTGNMYRKEYLRFKFALYNDENKAWKIWKDLDKTYEKLKDRS